MRGNHYKYQQRDRQRSRQKQRKDYLNKNNNYRNDRLKDRKSWKDNKQRQKKQPIQIINKGFNQINRNQISPFLVRVYYAINGSNSLNNLPKQRQIYLYLWMNTSLKQITQLLRAHLPIIRTKQRFVFYRVYEQVKDKKQQMVKKQMGTVYIHKKSQKGQDKTLGELKFYIGDFIDVSINYK